MTWLSPDHEDRLKSAGFKESLHGQWLYFQKGIFDVCVHKDCVEITKEDSNKSDSDEYLCIKITGDKAVSFALAAKEAIDE